MLQTPPIDLLPVSAHFVGIGGIGMSALAQMLQFQGVKVSGSDRALDNSENAKIISALRNQGIKLFPQDGSYAENNTPEVLVYSTAIEKDNPDFSVLPDITKVHRADMLARAINAMNGGNTIAVSGSCGKTTVTAWLAETLFLLGEDPVMIGGGLSNRFSSDLSAGNFRAGQGNFTVFEADESDKSLVQFSPDYSLVLNIGTDHYPKDELKELFGEFLKRTKKGAVVSDEVYNFLGAESFKHLKVAIFADQVVPLGELPFWNLESYHPEGGESKVVINGNLNLNLPYPGRHSALNAAAILAMCEMIGIPADETQTYLGNFQGVWRRFDFAGNNVSGAKVYDDYAHNVEKIISCINTAREVAEGKVIAVFQPHGFGPLKFMRQPLFEELEKSLNKDDIFVFMPVYYAGGSAAFTPTSEEVAEDYKINGKKTFLSFASRAEAIAELNSISAFGDVIIVMGARDNSLSCFAENFTC